jgi:uncharacterized membrane protein YciS (DUF1049 family)
VKRSLVWLGVAGLFVGMLSVGWMFRDRNSNSIDLELIWFQVSDIEIWWVILVAMALGGGLAAMPLSFAWLRSRLLNMRYRRAIKRLESELHEMRSLPLADNQPELREPVDPGSANSRTSARQV